MGRKKASQEALPGMERRDLPEIEQAADRYREVRDERCALSKRESEAKATLIQLMQQKGRSYYSYNGLIIQLSNQANVKVKSKDEDDDEPIGAFISRSREVEEEAGEIPERQAEQEGERERLHADAVARWRKERPATEAPDQIEIEIDPSMCVCGHEANSHDVDEIDSGAFIPRECMVENCHCQVFTEDNGGTPFPTEYPQEEINRIAEFYCVMKISEEKPVKICYVLEQPHIITGGMSKGGNYQSVDAWPILPLENVGEENTKTYKQMNAEYSEGLRKRFEEGSEDVREHSAFSYQNMKINCGSAKKPKWWVMVGPKQVFTVDYAAAYPDDEIEASVDTEGVIADDFTAPRCDECKRTDGAHTKECSQNPDRLTADDYLAYAEAHYEKNHQSHARKMAVTGLNDNQVRAWKLEQQASNGAEPEPTRESTKMSPVEAAIDR